MSKEIALELIDTLANELSNSDWKFGGQGVATAVSRGDGCLIVTLEDGAIWGLSAEKLADAPAGPDLCWDSSGYDDSDSAQWAFDELTHELTEFMEEVNPDGLWHAVVENFGWQHRNGTADIKASDGVHLLMSVLPKTECSYKIWLDREEKKITINNSHHDAPCGGEMYYISPRKDDHD